jgi:hypothetical protein
VLRSCGSFTLLDSQKSTIGHFDFGRGYDGQVAIIESKHAMQLDNFGW